MGMAVERIVVQTTAKDKLAIISKAKKLDMPIAELMRRGAFAYADESQNAELIALADAAKSATERAGNSIDDSLAFIAASNKRIAAMESKAARKNSRKLS
jgi:hypothetical protein